MLLLSIREASQVTAGIDKFLKATAYSLEAVIQAINQNDERGATVTELIMREGNVAIADKIKKSPSYINSGQQVLEARKLEMECLSKVNSALLAGLSVSASNNQLGQEKLIEATVEALRSIDNTGGSVFNRKAKFVAFKESFESMDSDESAVFKYHFENSDREYNRQLFDEILAPYMELDQEEAVELNHEENSF